MFSSLVSLAENPGRLRTRQGRVVKSIYKRKLILDSQVVFSRGMVNSSGNSWTGDPRSVGSALGKDKGIVQFNGKRFGSLLYFEITIIASNESHPILAIGLAPPRYKYVIFNWERNNG